MLNFYVQKCSIILNFYHLIKYNKVEFLYEKLRKLYEMI